MQFSMFSAEEPHAKATASPVSERDWMILVATSCLPMLQLLADIGPRGWFGKTSPVSFQTTADERLERFWDCLPESGSKSPPADGKLRELSRATKAHTASHGASLTLNLSEWTGLDGLSLNDDGVCSLSDILETGDVPRRYYLSALACQGILRRAEKRGKTLPAQLAQALRAGAPAEVFPPLSADADKGDQDPLVCAPIAFDSKASGRSGFGVGYVSPTLRAMSEGPGSSANGGGQVAVAQPPVVFQPRYARNGRGAPDTVASALTSEARETGKGDSAQCVATAWAVRRLTPVECERLQAMPDGYTDVPWRGAAGAPDGPRYKALGNSMSVNVMRWIGTRIEMVDAIFAK